MELYLPIPPEQLTRAERSILEFINTSTDAFLFLSIGQLAERLGLSEATLSRFARHVGCRDFKALKALVLEQAAAGPAVKLAGTLHQSGQFSPRDWLARQQACLETTAAQLDESEFNRAVDALAGAGRIYIHGKNASASLARLLHFRLRRLGLDTCLLPGSGSELLEGLAGAKKDDVVVLFSFSKLSREGRILLEQSRTAGYTTLAFVSRTCLPPDQAADINLFAYRGPEREYHSMAAPAALVDGLLVALGQALGPRSAAALERLQQLKKQYYPG